LETAAFTCPTAVACCFVLFVLNFGLSLGGRGGFAQPHDLIQPSGHFRELTGTDVHGLGTALSTAGSQLVRHTAAASSMKDPSFAVALKLRDRIEFPKRARERIGVAPRRPESELSGVRIEI